MNLPLSLICHAANESVIVVPTSVYYEHGQLNTKQICIELSCTECEPLTSADNWTAFVQANAADYPANKRNALAEDTLMRLTGFDSDAVGGIYGPVLIFVNQ